MNNPIECVVIHHICVGKYITSHGEDYWLVEGSTLKTGYPLQLISPALANRLVNMEGVPLFVEGCRYKGEDESGQSEGI